MRLLKNDETALFDLIEVIVIDLLDLVNKSITLESNFESDLGADDLDMYELLYTLEEVLSLKFPDEETLDENSLCVFKTIGSLYQYLQPKWARYYEQPKTAGDYAMRGNLYSAIYFPLIQYKKAIETDENCIEAYIGRGMLYQKAEKNENAIKDFSKVLEISPNYYIYLLRGDCYLGLADKQKEMNWIADINPESPMGDFRYDINKTLKKALKDFNSAIKIDNKNYQAFLGKGKSNYRLGNYDEAAKAYKKGMKINPLHHGAPEIMDLIEKGFDI